MVAREGFTDQMASEVGEGAREEAILLEGRTGPRAWRQQHVWLMCKAAGSPVWLELGRKSKRWCAVGVRAGRAMQGF